MNEITYTEGDLFAAVDAFAEKSETPGTIVIPHVNNSIGAWGAGFVIPLGRKYKSAEVAYRKWFANSALPDTVHLPGGKDFGLGKSQIFKVTTVNLTDIAVANMVAQHGISRSGRPLRYNALAACMDQVAQVAKTFRGSTIFCPMFGSGLAGGRWDFIEELIKDCWLNKGMDVRVFYLKGQTPEGWTPPAIEDGTASTSMD